MTILWKQIAFAALVLSTASCSGPSPAPSSDQSGDTERYGPSTVAASEATCLDKINAYRQANQLSPVQADEALNTCATAMSAYDLEHGEPDIKSLCSADLAGMPYEVSDWPRLAADVVDNTIHLDAKYLLVPELKLVGCSVRTNSGGFTAVALLSRLSPASPTTCSPTNPCTAGYCDYGPTCPAPGAVGKCSDASSRCPAFDATKPVCGCDGKMYKNDCDAANAGVQAGSDLAGCPVSEGKFRCGYGECAVGSEICVRDLWQTDYFHCAPLPAACGGTASCECANDKSVCPHNPPNLIGGLCLIKDGSVFVSCSEPG